MSHFLKNISGLFGYSRRERRASFIILSIILVILLIRFILPEKKSSLSITSPSVLFKEQPLRMARSSGNESAVLFDFDPNKASETDLNALGLNEKQVHTIIRYREKGGRFMRAEDLYRIYGIDSNLVLKLLPYIKIAEDSVNLNNLFKSDTSKKHYRFKIIPAKTDVNKCDSADLEKLPWIGPVLSARIIKYREILGGFYSIVQLKEIYGITDSTIGLISGRIKIDSSDVKKIDINKASYRDLIKHPYLERYEVQSILKFRSISGRIDSMSQLVGSRILTPSKAEKLKPYFGF